MIREVCLQIYQNKNLLMLCSVVIYILALFSVLSCHQIIVSLILTVLLCIAAWKNFLPAKIIIIWSLIFYFGIINTSLRIRETDSLLNLAPVNSTIYGKILSIPENKGNNKNKFYFDVKKIEYDGFTQTFNNEKALVSLETNEKFKIYDSYKIRGRLSTPFKSGNPSQFDYGNYLRNFNTYAVFYGHNPYEMRNIDIPCYEKIQEENSAAEKALQWINDKREYIMQIHAKYLKTPNLEILGGIVFGDDAVSPPENIVAEIVKFFAPKILSGKKILVTAGGTVEPIDPVRFIGNRSSGKMGYEIARAAQISGAEVILISGNATVPPPPNVKFVKVETALEMRDAVLAEFDSVDAVVMSAAVADYRVKNPADQKIKKSAETMTLELVKNPDILKELGALKKNQLLVGFAAETQNLEDYARRKIAEKNLDFIVANNVAAEGAGFSVDTNIITIINRGGEAESFPKMSKAALAEIIVQRVADQLK